MEIIGHKNVLDFFDKVIEHDNLSHAYCFTGPAHIGKRRIAEYIAAQLLKVDSEKLAISPDFHMIERSINEKTGKLRKDISIDQVRHVISALMQSTFVKDGYNISIIDQADLMSTGASNALLKTLEEPKDKTILFLITTDEAQLLPTIQSRCQMIYFSLVDAQSMRQLPEHTDREDMIVASAGRPGMVLSWMADNESWQMYTSEVNRFVSLWDKPFYEKLNIVEDMYGDKTDHIMARQRLQSALAVWQTQLLPIMKQKNTTASHMVSIEKGITEAQDLLGKNVHPRLLIEHILLQIP